MKDLDYGKDYRYAHNEEGGYAPGETYLPEELSDKAVLPAHRSRTGKEDF